MANHLEEKQWHKRADCGNLSSRKIFDSELHTDDGEITLYELCTVIKKLKNGKAAGPDGIAPDLWKVIARDADAL